MSDPPSAPVIRIGGVPLQDINDTDRSTTLSLLLWGPSGVGKTTLAATAPGRKLFVSFDLQGTASIRHLEDIVVADVSTENQDITLGYKNSDNPLNLKAALNLFDTVIIDSVTRAVQLALDKGIAANKGSTIERPSPGAYGTRNALTLQLIRNVAKTMIKAGKHCIFIAHEDAALLDEEGKVIKIGISLGGKLENQVPVDISEVWHMSIGTAGDRRIAVNPVRMRTPMKTRMWRTTPTSCEFTWRYDPDTDKGARLSHWVGSWTEAGHVKIALPK